MPFPAKPKVNLKQVLNNLKYKHCFEHSELLVFCKDRKLHKLHQLSGGSWKKRNEWMGQWSTCLFTGWFRPRAVWQKKYKKVLTVALSLPLCRPFINGILCFWAKHLIWKWSLEQYKPWVHIRYNNGWRNLEVAILLLPAGVQLLWRVSGRTFLTGREVNSRENQPVTLRGDLPHQQQMTVTSPSVARYCKKNKKVGLWKQAQNKQFLHLW